MTITLNEGEHVLAVVLANGEVIHAGEFRSHQDSDGRRFLDGGNCNNVAGEWFTDCDGIITRRI